MPIQRKRRRGGAPIPGERPPRTSESSNADALLVAVRETSETHGVLNVAELLARKEQINAHLIGVADRRTPLNDVQSSKERDSIHEHDRHRIRVRAKRRLHQTLGRAVYWSTDAAFGSLATVLAQETRRRRPRLILVAASATDGSRRRDARTILRTANAVDAPVLVVPPHQDLLPRRVLVATDFSQSSRRAAVAAMSVIGPRARVSLVHVEPDTKFEARGHRVQHHRRAERVNHLIQELRREIDKEAASLTSTSRSHGIVKETLLLRGEAAAVILDCAARRKSDLIVIGTRRLSKNGSMPRGSVAMTVLVGAACAVLVARPGGHTAV